MKHVVTTPRAPFRTSDGALEVHQLPSWQDNLIWLAVCTATREAAAVDGPEAETVLAYCEAHNIRLTTILNTHTHPDHVGINRDLDKRGLLKDMTVVGYRGRTADIPGLTRGVGEGDEVRVGQAVGRVMLTEGHIDGHISFVFDDVLFCGDTLFAGGCGYLFDGPPAKMYESLSRLGALSADTRVCCAHEYTEDNLKFAWTVEPDNDALRERIIAARALRATGGCTVPSTIGEERATNPFIRTDSPTLRAKVAAAMPNADLSEAAAVFAATRMLKNQGLHKKLGDGDWPR